MSIVKRKNKAGGIYYFNTTTSKFASEAEYKRKGGIGKIDAKFQARKGQPSKAYCSTVGKELAEKNTSKAGKALKNCVRPFKKLDSQRAMFANIARRKG